MATKSEVQLANERFWEWLNSGDAGLQKEAADSINEFTRTRVREDSFTDKILPPLPLSNDELDRQIHTDKPVKIIDKEIDNPPAISVPYGAMPINFYIRGNKYQVTFARILSPKFTKDQSELRTWNMDIRQVISDNSIKDMLAEKDSKFIGAVNTGLVGLNSVAPYSGAVQWQQRIGGITRDTFNDSMKILPSLTWHLEASTLLLNNVTIYEFTKMGRDEMGGDISETIFRDGWTLKKFFNRDFLITIKRDLVPDLSIYQFTDPRFMGKSFELEPITMYLDRKAFMLEWFCYTELGLSLGHLGGIARCDFA